MVATGNSLLTMAARPIFAVLQTHLCRSILGYDFRACVSRDHHAILAAVESGDADAAATRAQEHLALPATDVRACVAFSLTRAKLNSGNDRDHGRPHH